ncbi:MAG: hypothetical protein HFJ41_03695 [Clostridia bacterium]|nr:hypothetical protein [Clostridia bacterium]
MKTVKAILGVIVILFIFVTISAIMNSPMKKWSNFKEEPLKSNITVVFQTLNMDTSKIVKIGKDKEWSNGPRYKILYKENENIFYYVYAYEDGQITSISDGTKDIYTNDNIKIENSNSADITLKYNELGEYGKYVTFDGAQYIKYVIPAGEYEVSALVKNSMFFIEKSKVYKNSFGHDETETVSTVQLSEIGSKETITLKSDECISLVINAAISLKKLN